MRRSVQRRGAASVEFALVALPLFLLLIGLIDYGWIFLKAQQVTQAARAGARVAITPDATEDKVRKAVNGWMTQAGITTFELDINPKNLANLTPGTTVTVRVSVDTKAPGVHLTGSRLVPVPEKLRAVASMAKEGPK